MMKNILAILISLVVCLAHTSGLCYASYSPPILETRNWQLETDSEGLKGGGSILANTFTFGYSDQWGWTDSTQYQGFEYDVSRFSASVAQGALIGAGTAGLGNLAAAGNTAAQVGYGGVLAVNAGYGGYQVGSGINSMVYDGNYIGGAAQIVGGGLSIAGSIKGANAIDNPDLFARRTGLLNNNDYLRIGWGWSQPAKSEVFRIAIGPYGSSWHTHIDLFYR